MTIPVLLETELGTFTISVDAESAPITGANFLGLVDGGHLDDAIVYRIVTMANQKPETAHKIEVVEWGVRASEDEQKPFPHISHETTATTGLRHKHLTVSMGRYAVGTASSEFFICIGDQPELDFGGRRNADGQGFAAFGQVTAGEDTVMRLFGKAEAGEYIETPIRFTRVRRA